MSKAIITTNYAPVDNNNKKGYGFEGYKIEGYRNINQLIAFVNAIIKIGNKNNKDSYYTSICIHTTLKECKNLRKHYEENKIYTYDVNGEERCIEVYIVELITKEG